MILGSATELVGEEKLRALDVLTEHFLPGRLAEIRKSTEQEVKATSVVALPLIEFSMKVSNGEPDDLPEDLDSPIWAGIVPMIHSWGIPRPAENLAPGILPPDYLANWPKGRS